MESEEIDMLRKIQETQFDDDLNSNIDIFN